MGAVGAGTGGRFPLGPLGSQPALPGTNFKTTKFLLGHQSTRLKNKGQGPREQTAGETVPWAAAWAHLRHWGLFVFLFFKCKQQAQSCRSQTRGVGLTSSRHFRCGTSGTQWARG